MEMQRCLLYVQTVISQLGNKFKADKHAPANLSALSVAIS